VREVAKAGEPPGGKTQVEVDLLHAKVDLLQAEVGEETHYSSSETLLRMGSLDHQFGAG